MLDGGRSRLHLDLRDAHGQVVSLATPAAPQVLRQQYGDFIGDLAGSDVIVWVLPCPPAGLTAEGRRRFFGDVMLGLAYVQEALDQRRSATPASLAVVLSQIDARYDSESQARRLLPKEILRGLEARLKPLLSHPALGRAAMIPVSAWGFGRGVFRPASGSAGEGEWLLRKGAVPTPFNVGTLMSWLALAGLGVQPVGRDGAGAELVRAGRALRAALQGPGSWWVPLGETSTTEGDRT